MNITDVEDLKDVKEPWLDFLLARQSELIEKYKKIEGMPDSPMDINTKETQIWVKDFLWRVTEELMEAYESRDNYDHYIEELSDALHFYLEIFILVDYTPKEMGDKGLEMLIKLADETGVLGHGLARDLIFDVVYHLGLAGNFLRNKKWKQTQVFVDKDKFYEELNKGFGGLILLIINSGVCCKYDLLNLYYKKFQVNQFRIRSRY